ncbi:hypothetical protein Fmac_022494 [Flemingia macrophylla]|uniref:ATP-grasp domain-containing protein n=1 Tax=Flemingia macrophylla TaxID=520843 RepID=A0ABD1LZW0_9FABA
MHAKIRPTIQVNGVIHEAQSLVLDAFDDIPRELIGAKLEAIKKVEDHELFKQAMRNIGIKTPPSGIGTALDECIQISNEIGEFPLIVRPAFTLVDTGGGIAYNREDLVEICKVGLAASLTNQVLIEKSLLGWKEYELQVSAPDLVGEGFRRSRGCGRRRRCCSWAWGRSVRGGKWKKRNIGRREKYSGGRLDIIDYVQDHNQLCFEKTRTPSSFLLLLLLPSPLHQPPPHPHPRHQPPPPLTVGRRRPKLRRNKPDVTTTPPSFLLLLLPPPLHHPPPHPYPRHQPPSPPHRPRRRDRDPHVHIATGATHTAPTRLAAASRLAHPHPPHPRHADPVARRHEPPLGSQRHPDPRSRHQHPRLNAPLLLHHGSAAAASGLAPPPPSMPSSPNQIQVTFPSAMVFTWCFLLPWSYL